MFYYYTDKGLTSLEIIANNFKNRTWWLPDFIPDDTLETIKKCIQNKDSRGQLEFYQINDDFTWAAKVNGNDPKIFLVSNFFGKETKLGTTSPPNTITVRDSTWLPCPFSPVEHHQIWFNSLGSIIRNPLNTKGSSIVSPFRLSGINEVPNIFQHPSLTWKEIDIRWKNFYALADLFGGVLFIPDFPTVFPIRLKNRDKVLPYFSEFEIWENKYNLPNILYDELMLLPIDSRYDPEKLTMLAKIILDFNK